MTPDYAQGVLDGRDFERERIIVLLKEVVDTCLIPKRYTCAACVRTIRIIETLKEEN